MIVSCQPISPEGRPSTVDAVSAVDVHPGETVAAESVAKGNGDSDSADAVQSADSVDAGDADAGQATDAGADTENDDGASEDTDGAMNESRWSDPALIEAGHQAYRDNYCGVCHRLAVAGTTGPFGPAHDEMGPVAWERLADPNYRGAATNATEYIRESIVEPNVYLVPGFEVTQHRMPPYTHLDDTTIDAMVAFLLAQE